MKRSGFTLVELMVSISIIVILAVITVATLNQYGKTERFPESARSVASYIEGARDRAIFARKPVGVRLILDENGPRNAANNPITATSIMYVEALENITTNVCVGEDDRTLKFWTSGPDGRPGVATLDDDGGGLTDDVLTESGFAGSDDEPTDAEWSRYYSRGFLDDRGVRVTLTKNSVSQSAVAIYDGTDWILTKDWAGGTLLNRLDVEIELTPTYAVPMDGQSNRELGRGICLDLETSRRTGRIPADWYNPATQEYSDYMDLMFDATGRPFATISNVLSFQLVIADVADVETTIYPMTAPVVFYDMTSRPQREMERLVSVGMRTGKIHTSAINFDDSNANDIPDDPFFFAETGR